MRWSDYAVQLENGINNQRTLFALLARLYTRPSLEEIDPFVFGGTSSASTSSLSSTPAQIVEIFGPEGVGKTELVLHCAAKVCLVTNHKNFELKGLGLKVIIVDADSKFSILRLAVILEKQIRYELLMNRAKPNGGIKREKLSSPYCSDQTSENILSKSSNSQQTQAKNSGNPSERKGDGEGTGNVKDSDKIHHSDMSLSELTNEAIEDIIKESLKNVQILKVKNSQQLLASLLSLEISIAGDPTYSLLVIDSISAFYWIDRLGLVENNTARIMMPISDAIFQLVNKFGLTCLAISSTFFSGGKNSQIRNIKDSRGFTSNCGDSGKNSWMYSEYLGKGWVSARSKRIVLSRFEISEDEILSLNSDMNGSWREQNMRNEGDRRIHAFCCSTKKKKLYMFRDDFMQGS